MKTALYISATAALVAIAVLTGILAYNAAVMPSRVGRDLQRRADAAQATLDAARGDLARTAADLVDRVKSIERTADRRLASLQNTADARLAFFGEIADYHLEVLTQKADKRIGEGIAELGKLRADLKPVLASTDELLAQSSGTVAVLRPQLLGLAAAGKVTLGESAQAARRFDATLPRFLELGQGVGTNLQQTTANVERITRPDKWWMTGAKIAAPVAGGLVWGAVTGKKR